MRNFNLALAGLIAAGAASAFAASPADLRRQFEMELRASGTGFSGFSAERGQQFFHAAAGKVRAPRAPGALGTERWLEESCYQVLGRVCSSQEKGDILQYLIAPKGGR